MEISALLTSQRVADATLEIFWGTEQTPPAPASLRDFTFGVSFRLAYALSCCVDSLRATSTPRARGGDQERIKAARCSLGKKTGTVEVADPACKFEFMFTLLLLRYSRCACL
jgi:hypothetical protein